MRLLKEPSGVLDLTCVLVRFHTRRFLDGNKLLSCWFLKAAAGERVWFGGVVGYCTHWLLSQHTHSHLKHTHSVELKGGCWISHSHPELFLCWKRDHLTLSYPPPSPGLQECGFRLTTSAGFSLLSPPKPEILT